MNDFNTAENIDKIISKYVGNNITIYLYKESSNNNLKKIKHGKLTRFSIKDNIMCFEFENLLCKHDNNFYMPLPYYQKTGECAEFDYGEIHLSYKSNDLLEFIDADDLLDLEEQNNSKSPLYNKEIVIKWS